MASSNPLAEAKAALSHAQDFTKSAEGSPKSQFAPHEFSAASYKMAAPKKTNEIGESLKWKAEQAKIANP